MRTTKQARCKSRGSESARKKRFIRVRRLDKSQGDLAEPKYFGDKQESTTTCCLFNTTLQLRSSERLISNVEHLIINSPLQSVFNLAFCYQLSLSMIALLHTFTQEREKSVEEKTGTCPHQS